MPPDQQFRRCVTQLHNRQNSRCLGVVSSSKTAGAAIEQRAFASGANPASKTASTIWPAAGSMNDGALVQAITYNTNDSQKWYISPL